MRYALILAGGSGTRLWPMSRGSHPKQLIPLIEGKSLLEIAYDRLDSLIPHDYRYICAGENHRQLIVDSLPGFQEERFLGEPIGRDTLAALGFSSAIISRSDPEAVIAVFTADHLIDPVDEFRVVVTRAFEIVESTPATIMTYGVPPTHPATGFGYLELGEPYEAGSKIVCEFKEKPGQKTAEEYVAAGSDAYLWNSGMFVWKAKVFLDCLRFYEPDVSASLNRIAAAWGGDLFASELTEVYPGLKKISVDFAVMEKASVDPSVVVAALPLALSWRDLGSWASFAETKKPDEEVNVSSNCETLFMESRGNLSISSDPKHLIATIGCEDLVIVHTPDATLVCPKGEAEKIKQLNEKISQKFDGKYV